MIKVRKIQLSLPFCGAKSFVITPPHIYIIKLSQIYKKISLKKFKLTYVSLGWPRLT